LQAKLVAMQSKWFWKSWHTDLKVIGYLFAFIFLLSFVMLWFNYSKGAESIIHWNKIEEQKVLESTVHSFQTGPFELAVPAENFVILEYFNGSNIELNQLSSLIFIGVLIFSIVILLTIITTLERFWYFTGMALFIIFVVTLRLDVLSIFGQRNQTPAIVVLFIYASISFYFQSLNRNLSFAKRLIVFLFITSAIALVIFFFSNVYVPFLHLAVTGYSAALVLSVLFILMTAHEIPATFVSIVSQGNRKNLQHFLLVGVVYILNVIVTALHELDVIHWNFIYINLFLLVSVSAVVGLWGFRQREVLYENIFSFEPVGAYFYISLASICFVTMAQLLGSSNDPALKIVRDVIIFSHVGYGVIFILYVISNFILMLAHNLPVHKVLYKPTRMPYFTFRFAGLIATLGFVFYSGWHQYIYNSIGGFYNNIGDLYELLDKSAIAEAYYDQGAKYGFANSHANYALGKLKTSRYNFDKAIENYEAANRRRPNVFSLTNEANLYYWKGDVRGAIKAYRTAIAKIPAGETNTNLAFAYARLRNIDSVAYYLDRAMKDKNAKASAQANFIATAGLEYLPLNCDSLLGYFDNPYPATLANAVAVSTVQRHELKTKIDVFKDDKLDLQSATLLNNYIIRNAKTLDTTFTNKAIKMASDSVNADFREALKAALAFVYYHQGNVSKALEILAEQVYLSQSYQGKYNYIMGLFALEQNNPRLAASYFKYAVDSDYKEGKLYYAIALTEDRELQAALNAWDSVAAGGEETEKQMAAQIKNVLNSTAAQVLSLADPDKYQFCRYKIKMNDSIFFDKVINSFNDDNYRAQALLDVAQRFSEAGDLKRAVRNFEMIRGLKLTDKKLYENIQHSELLLLAERRELRNLAKQINKGITFDDRPLEKIYFTALLNEAANDTTNASRNFNIVGKYNPYFEQAIIAAADYFKTHGNNKMKSYNLLVEAVHINNNSVKLLKAYAAEALRMGFPEYAASALEQVRELEQPIK
jgi:hypothetical protein